MGAVRAPNPASALDAAAAVYYERPAAAEEAALRVRHEAARAGADALGSRAVALLGAISLNRGDVRGAFRLAAEAEDAAERSGDPHARADAAALAAQLHFWSGGYGEATRAARAAIAHADASGSDAARLAARRACCVVMGNLGVPGWGEEIREMVRLSVALGDAWQEAISRNDLGHHLMVEGHRAAAAAELERGVAVATTLEHHAFALAVLACTRAELRLVEGDQDGALADVERALGWMTAGAEIHPYLFGMTVRLQVQTLLALGRGAEAERCGDAALTRLGDRVPQARGMILQGVAAALREAGRLDAAYDALARGAALEREALLELAELQVRFERASADARAARREADELSAANRELRDQADRDALTGLHNRRYLDARLAELEADPPAGAVSVAVVDLDDFKAVNDVRGHAVGDEVLVRVAGVLAAHVRASDHLVRTGGEELLVVMPGTDGRQAVGAAERLLAALREEPWDDVWPGLRLTASAGVATRRPGAPLDPSALLAEADRRLYAAKREGRDRVVAEPA